MRTLVHYSKAFGVAVGLVVGSFFSDYLGRRRVIYTSFMLLCCFQCGTGVSEDPVYFITCQGGVGLGAGLGVFFIMLLFCICLVLHLYSAFSPVVSLVKYKECLHI